MAQDVMRLADQLFAGVATNVDESLVDISDDTARIGDRNDLGRRIIGEVVLNIGHRLIVAHMNIALQIYQYCSSQQASQLIRSEAASMFHRMLGRPDKSGSCNLR